MTVAEFKERYPDFVSVDNAVVLAQIEESDLLLNSALFGDRYPIVLGLSVAHELSVNITKTASSTTPVISRTIERGSITYAVPKPTNKSSYYFSTKYGKKLIEILENNREIFAGTICD
jgi:hypothetical protein